MLGFGIEAAALLLTPVIIDVVRRVAIALAKSAGDAVEKEGSEAVGGFVHKLFHRGEGGDEAKDDVPDLSPEQLQEVREIAYEPGARARRARGPRGPARGRGRREPGDGLMAAGPSGEQPAATQPLRVPVGHDVPVLPARRLDRGREPVPLQLALLQRLGQPGRGAAHARVRRGAAGGPGGRGDNRRPRRRERPLRRLHRRDQPSQGGVHARRRRVSSSPRPWRSSSRPRWSSSAGAASSRSARTTPPTSPPSSAGSSPRRAWSALLASSGTRSTRHPAGSRSGVPAGTTSRSPAVW